MKPITILSQEIGTPLAIDFERYITREIENVQIDKTTYKKRKVFGKENLIIAERTSEPWPKFFETTFGLSKEGVAIFALMEDGRGFISANLRAGNYMGLTGVIFRSDTIYDFVGFDNLLPRRPVEYLLQSYMIDGSGNAPKLRNTGMM